MRKVEIIHRDFRKISRLQPDWRGTQGRAILEDRKIYLDTRCPPRTVWGKRTILEHERAHFAAFDIGLDDELTPAQEELLADWLGLVRTPDRDLHINEQYMKRWILDGWGFKKKDEKILVLTRIIKLLRLWPKRVPHVVARALLQAL